MDDSTHNKGGDWGDVTNTPASCPSLDDRPPAAFPSSCTWDPCSWPSAHKGRPWTSPWTWTGGPGPPVSKRAARTLYHGIRRRRRRRRQGAPRVESRHELRRCAVASPPVGARAMSVNCHPPPPRRPPESRSPRQVHPRARPPPRGPPAAKPREPHRHTGHTRAEPLSPGPQPRTPTPNPKPYTVSFRHASAEYRQKGCSFKHETLDRPCGIVGPPTPFGNRA